MPGAIPLPDLLPLGIVLGLGLGILVAGPVKFAGGRPLRRHASVADAMLAV